MLKLTAKFQNDTPYPLSPKDRAMDGKNYVYVFRNEMLDIYKIGITGNPKERQRSLSCSCGSLLQDIIIIELQPDYDESAEYVEKYLHKYFKEKRLAGEWFRLSIRDIIEIKDLFWYIEGDYIWDNVKEYLLKEIEAI